jgi:antibiotic biosynthesis monooxygenase (ABM) superfamily enzyme
VTGDTVGGMPAPSKPPAQWKMAIMTWAALLPMVIGLAYLFASFHLPFLPEVMLSTAIPVVMLTWVIMPRATQWFYRWLYPHEVHA